MQYKTGFTLAELLIALAILGIIAVFSIPKILQSQQDQRYNAIAKEAASAMAQAFQKYSSDSTVDAYTAISDLTPYLNYVKTLPSGAIDDVYGMIGSQSCTNNRCFQLANGAIIRDPTVKTVAGTGNYFGVVDMNHYIYFYVDPNGILDDTTTTNGPGKSVAFVLYPNGKITSIDNCKSGDTTYLIGIPYNAWCPGNPPPSWFHW